MTTLFVLYNKNVYKKRARLAKREKPQHTWVYVKISSENVTQKSPS